MDYTLVPRLKPSGHDRHALNMDARGWHAPNMDVKGADVVGACYSPNQSRMASA